jgi:hypothetical protein
VFIAVLDGRKWVDKYGRSDWRWLSPPRIVSAQAAAAVLALLREFEEDLEATQTG